MHLRYDDDLMEAAVFLGASGRRPGVPPLQLARFHRAREKLYHVLDPEERNAAFFRLHLEWFREWGLETPISAVLKEFPLLAAHLAMLAIRMSRGKHDEGAELYVNDAGERNGMLALRPERFIHDAALTTFLRHECMHLHDMLDPAFGYAPTLECPELNAAQQRLARERYRLLWDITIDGRLTAGGHPPITDREQHAAAFRRGYSFWPEQRQAETFEALWGAAAPCHADFLALIADPRGLRETHRPAPGAACPLCDFSTFTWADPAALRPEIAARVAAEFPAWSPEQGLCHRCLEAYQALAAA